MQFPCRVSCGSGRRRIGSHPPCLTFRKMQDAAGSPASRRFRHLTEQDRLRVFAPRDIVGPGWREGNGKVARDSWLVTRGGVQHPDRWWRQRAKLPASIAGCRIGPFLPPSVRRSRSGPVLQTSHFKLDQDNALRRHYELCLSPKREDRQECLAQRRGDAEMRKRQSSNPETPASLRLWPWRMPLFDVSVSVLHAFLCRFDESAEGFVLFPFVQV